MVREIPPNWCYFEWMLELVIGGVDWYRFPYHFSVGCFVDGSVLDSGKHNDLVRWP